MAAVAGPIHPRHPGSPRRVASHSHVRKATQQTYVPTTAPVGLTSIPDPYYGHEETAKLCSKFITALFSCPDTPPPSTSASSAPPPPLAQFIGYALHRTRLHSCVTFTALFLLSRLKTRFPAARGSSGHRLFISAFMIASKVVCDDTYSNKSWCVVGQGMFSLKEINQMEREMCGYLEWQLNFPAQDLAEFEARVRKEFGRSTSTSRIPSLSINTAVSVARKPQPAGVGLPSPPPSPPPTPDAERSQTPSPASSSGVQTPPTMAEEHDGARIVPASAPCHSFPCRGAPAASAASPPKGDASATGFARATLAVW